VEVAYKIPLMKERSLTERLNCVTIIEIPIKKIGKTQYYIRKEHSHKDQSLHPLSKLLFFVRTKIALINSGHCTLEGEEANWFRITQRIGQLRQ